MLLVPRLPGPGQAEPRQPDDSRPVRADDEYPVYESAIRDTSGQVVTPPRTDCPVRPRNPYTVVPPQVTDAIVHQERENNRVVAVSTRLVFGTAVALALALVASAVSTVMNTCFGERHNAPPVTVTPFGPSTVVYPSRHALDADPAQAECDCDADEYPSPLLMPDESEFPPHSPDRPHAPESLAELAVVVVTDPPRDSVESVRRS